MNARDLRLITKGCPKYWGTLPLDIVHVHCPPEICRARNIARGDRFESQSEEEAEIMAEGIAYSAEVDTSLHSPRECADIIMSALFGTSRKEK